MASLQIELSIPFAVNEWMRYGSVPPENTPYTFRQPSQGDRAEKIVFLSEKEGSQTTVFRPIVNEIANQGGVSLTLETLMPVAVLHPGDSFYVAEQYIKDTEGSRSYPTVIRVTQK